MFTGDNNLVTLGNGLVRLDKAEDNKIYKALLGPRDTINVTIHKCYLRLEYVSLLIHTEDDKGKDIFIKCSKDQLFYTYSGNLIPAYKLKGEKLMSIGRNNTYCVSVGEGDGYLPMYSIEKSQRTEIDYVFINGIKVKYI